MKRSLIRRLSVVIAAAGALALPAGAMHIAEGMLPAPWAFGWMAVCVPFVAAGFLSIKKKVSADARAKVLLAMCGAFAFVLSALKIPSVVNGSCSHPTGVGLGAGFTWENWTLDLAYAHLWVYDMDYGTTDAGGIRSAVSNIKGGNSRDTVANIYSVTVGYTF